MINSHTLEIGRQFQDFILYDLGRKGISFMNYTSKKYQFKVGENTAGIEIKHDMLFRKTNNLFIESQTKTKYGQWFNSGINNNDNSWLFLIGDEKKYWIFGKKSLKLLLNKSEYNFREIVNSTGDSKGYLLPVNIADEYAEKVCNNG